MNEYRVEGGRPGREREDREKRPTWEWVGTLAWICSHPGDLTWEGFPLTVPSLSFSGCFGIAGWWSEGSKPPSTRLPVPLLMEAASLSILPHPQPLLLVAPFIHRVFLLSPCSCCMIKGRREP